MQVYIRPFQPVLESTLNLAVTAASQSITVPTPRNGNGMTMRIVNSGTQTVFYNINGAAAVATSIPILPNTVETFWLPPDAITVRFIAAATGSTVYLTIGESA